MFTRPHSYSVLDHSNYGVKSCQTESCKGKVAKYLPDSSYFTSLEGAVNSPVK